MRALFYSTLLVLSTCTWIHGQSNQRHPNFIIIYSDDQRRDGLGAYGNEEIKTPALDRLASEAVRFSRAFPVFSLCSPSRAALLTGRYGSANGVLGLGSALNAGEKTIASYLKDSGYNTALSGKWHIKQTPQQVGFDFYSYFLGNGTYYNRPIHDNGRDVKPAIHCDEYCVDRSIDFLRQAAQSDKPFFLLHCTQLPHMNHQMRWDAKPETLAKYTAGEMPVPKNRLDDLSDKPEYLKTVRNLTQAKKYGYPDAEAIQKHTKEYYAVITEMDDALGRLIREIDALGLRENTYIIFMSDNGWMLGDHGLTSKVLPYRASTDVPLFVLGPGLRPRVEEHIALNIDIAPTLLDLAGINRPANLHGMSLVPVLNGKARGWRKAFVYEGLGDYGGAKPNLTVIDDRYRYIVTYDDSTLTKVNFRELYDVENDPWEMNNLIGKSLSKRVKQTLSEFQALIEEHKHKILKE
jgi:arylsulfatase A-like enzyme